MTHFLNRKFLQAILFFTFIVAQSFLFNSCKNKLETGSWNAELLFPIAYSNLTISDLVADSLISTEADNSLSLVYRNTIFSLNLADEVLEFPDTSFDFIFRLDSLALSDRSIVDSISMGQLALQMIADGNILGSYIIAQDGNLAIIPAFSNITADSVVIDATSFFQQATISSGTLEMKIKNDFPLPITNFIFQLKNQMSGTTLLQDTIPSIPAGTTATNYYDLSGYTVEGTLVANVLNISSPGSGGQVQIDTNDAIILTMTLLDVHVSDATAIFPAQDLFADSSFSELVVQSAELRTLGIRSGILRVIAESTIEDSLTVTFSLPGAVDSFGNTFITVSKVPPAPANSSIVIQKDFLLDGYTLDLSGENGGDYNSYQKDFRISIDSTGNLVHISSEDSVHVTYSMLDIIPEYIEGYVGMHEIHEGPDTTFNDAFEMIKGGQIHLEDVKLIIGIENGLGIQGGVVINEFKAIHGSDAVKLESPLVGELLLIDPATNNPVIPANTFYSLNNSNSNAKEMLELFPDKLVSDVQLYVNPFGDYSNHNDFAYHDSKFKINADIEIPLSFFANHLLLQDTIDFSIGATDAAIDNIVDGEINLIAYNGFPFDVDLQVYLLDDNNQIFDSLLVITNIEAGTMDGTCRVISNSRSVLKTPVDQEQIDLLRTVSKAIISASLNTNVSAPTCNGEFPKIYSDYEIKVTLSGRFNYLMDEL